MKLSLVSLATILCLACGAVAEVTIDPGVTEVVAGRVDAVEVPIEIRGGGGLTDFVGAVAVGGASITGFSYAGSIWGEAPGGFVDLGTIGFPAPAQTIDPNLSLAAAGEEVDASGVLITITIDVSDLPIGEYPITLSGTAAGDTEVYRSGTAPPTTVLPGTLRIIEDPGKPIDPWRETNFPASFSDPSQEATIWGNLADPDLDRITNLLEFYFGTDPNDPAQPTASATLPGMPTIRLAEDAGGVYLTLDYSRRREAPCLDVDLGVGTDLETWDYLEGDIEDVGVAQPIDGTDYEFVTRRYGIPAHLAGERLFLKLRVQTVDP